VRIKQGFIELKQPEGESKPGRQNSDGDVDNEEQ
jgi:hypothetical protein